MGGNRLTRSLRRGIGSPMELTVEVGQVVCPVRGAVDIELCFTCSAYRGLHDGRSERLVCAPPSGAELAYAPFGYVPR